MGKVVFVYNADSSFLGKSVDFLHKLISPKTYQCNLCALTHDNFNERQRWKEFRERTSFEFEFMYKDQFKVQYTLNHNKPFPCVFFVSGEKIKPLICNQEISSCKTVDDLIMLLSATFMSRV